MPVRTRHFRLGSGRQGTAFLATCSVKRVSALHDKHTPCLAAPTGTKCWAEIAKSLQGKGTPRFVNTSPRVNITGTPPALLHLQGPGAGQELPVPAGRGHRPRGAAAPAGRTVRRAPTRGHRAPSQLLLRWDPLLEQLARRACPKRCRAGEAGALQIQVVTAIVSDRHHQPGQVRLGHCTSRWRSRLSLTGTVSQGR